MNPFAIAKDLISQSSLPALFTTSLIAGFVIANYFVSHVVRNPNGRNQLLSALHAGKFAKKMRHIGVKIMLSRFLHRKKFQISGYRCSIFSPSTAVTNVVLLIVMISLAAAPWIAAISQSDVWLGPVIVTNPIHVSRAIPFLLVLILVAIMHLVSSTHWRKAVKFFVFALSGPAAVSMWLVPTPFSMRNADDVIVFSTYALVFAGLSSVGVRAIGSLIVFLAMRLVFAPDVPGEFHASPLDLQLLFLILIISCLATYIFNADKGGLVEIRRTLGWSVIFLASSIASLYLLHGNLSSVTEYVPTYISISIMIPASYLIAGLPCHAQIVQRPSLSVLYVSMACFFCLVLAYWIGIRSWPIVLILAIYVCLLSALAVASIFSVCITINFARLGFLSSRPLFWAAIDFVASIFVLALCLNTFLWILNTAQARPGIRLMRREDILGELRVGDPGHFWLAMCLLIPALIALFHLVVAMCALLAFVPQKIKNLVVRLLEISDEKTLGYERPLATIIISTWTAGIPIVGVYTGIFIVYFVVTGFGSLEF